MGFGGTARAGMSTYTAEEVADEDDEHATRNIVARVEALKWACLAVAVEDGVVLDLADDGLGREVVVGGNFALKVWRVHVDVLGGGWKLGAGGGSSCR